MYNRIRLKGMNVIRYPSKIARYVTPCSYTAFIITVLIIDKCCKC